jgi:hypothetical protein
MGLENAISTSLTSYPKQGIMQFTSVSSGEVPENTFGYTITDSYQIFIQLPFLMIR